jgi:hypothetical protein
MQICGTAFLPMVALFVFKRILVWFITRQFLVSTNDPRKRLELRNKRVYLILNHFNFFFDCLIITFVCLFRVVISALVSLFYMPRLDCSIYGRHMESKDIGFISFASFLHMEVNQTHPAKLVFCELLIQAFINAGKVDQSIEMKPLNRKYRNKWLLLYTLIKNPMLKKQRKHYRKVYDVRFETLGDFMQRRMHSKKEITKLPAIGPNPPSEISNL